MKRLLEKLAAERKAKEEVLKKRLAKMDEDNLEKITSESLEKIKSWLTQLEASSAEKKPKKFLGLKLSALPDGEVLTLFQNLFRAFQLCLEHQFKLIEKTRHDLRELIELANDLGEARDREWDALGSNHVGIIFKSLEWRVDDLKAQWEETRALLERAHWLRAKLEEVLLALGEKPKPALGPLRETLSSLRDWRYASFENRFRGSQAKVKEQLENYAALFPTKGKVLDLGCGRGEMVEILRARGIEAIGIDLNEEMIALCQSRNLPCEKGDLIEKLAACEDNSLAGIFSSQVIEHLNPPVLEVMIDLCYLKLAPSGVLILETVNPTSVFALVQVYFLDPSHQRPIHPQSLKFLLETAGFKKIEIRYSAPLAEERLKELPTSDEKTMILNQNLDRLNELLFAPVNYAAIAWK
ncbi:MAG: class I SAM-dependent methyltransferase [Candidatus Aminicenantes bacterium]|nr:class I SAM-dependent methyltransferase [Candidatus Aminicenantes bacterium]